MSGTAKYTRGSSYDLAAMLNSTFFKKGSTGRLPGKSSNKARVEPIDEDSTTPTVGNFQAHLNQYAHMSLLTLRFQQREVERSYKRHLRKQLDMNSAAVFLLYEGCMLLLFLRLALVGIIMSAVQLGISVVILIYLIRRCPDEGITEWCYRLIYIGLVVSYAIGCNMHVARYDEGLMDGIQLLTEDGTGCGLDGWGTIVNCSKALTELLLSHEGSRYVSVRVLSLQVGFSIMPLFLPIFSFLICALYSVALLAGTLSFFVQARYSLDALNVAMALILLLITLWTIWNITQKNRVIFWIARCEKEFRIAAEDEALTAKTVVTNLKVEREKIKKLIDKVTDDDYHLNIILSSLHVDSSQVQKGDKIGSGALGNIYKGTYHGDQVAIKTIRPQAMTEKSVANFLKEIQILGPLKHPNIICMYGASWKVRQPEQMYILLEYAENGTLEELLANPDYSWRKGRKRLVSGILKAVCYLHHHLKKPIIHRDLKPSNILINGYDAKISDFGVAKQIERLGMGPEDGLTLTRSIGSPLWMSPELINAEFYNEKVDVYAFAMILLEVVVGDGSYLLSCKRKAGKDGESSSYRPPIPESVRMELPEVVKLIEDCWSETYQDRPDFLTISARSKEILTEEEETFGPMSPKSSSVRKNTMHDKVVGSGRSYDFYGSNRDDAHTTLVRELRDEIQKQREEFTEQLNAQKKEYEEKLNSLASAVL